MTDNRIEKIRAFLVGIADADGVSTILARAIEKKILPYIDSLQEEPNITGIKSKYPTGKLKECIDNVKKAKLNAMLDDSLSKETKESWNERLGKEEPVAMVLDKNGKPTKAAPTEYTNGFTKGSEWQKNKDKEAFELLKEWFEDIAEKCEHLTSGNVSHNGKMIRGFARNCAEYIKTDLL